MVFFVFLDESVLCDIGINIKHVMVLSVVELCCIGVRCLVVGRHFVIFLLHATCFCRNVRNC